MPSCSVKWCSNHTSTCSLKSKNGVSFHRFPKDEVMCQKWVEAVRFERRDPWWTSSNASRICSLHFKESDISSTPCKVNILAKTAVPICTMVRYNDNQSNVTSKAPSDELTNRVKSILKTYERKKNMDVLREKQLNIINKLNETVMSKTKKVVNPNITAGLICQTNPPRQLDTNLFKLFQESNSLVNIKLKSNANANLNTTQKKTVPTEFNKNDKSYNECCKSNILVKLNDNTKLILDKDLSNDTDTELKQWNTVSKELNKGTNENLTKLTLKELKRNENEKPNRDVTNTSNSDMFVTTIKNGTVELNPNISNSYIGKILKTYMPKRKVKLNDKNNIDKRKRQESIKKSKGIWSINMEKGLNYVKCKDIKKIKVNVYPKDAYIKNKHSNRNNLRGETNSLSNTEKKVCAFRNVNKTNFRSNLFNRPVIQEDKPKGIKPNMDGDKDKNVIDIDEFITKQPKVSNTNVSDTDHEIVSDLFENSINIRDVSDMPYNSQETNKSTCVESNIINANNINSVLDKETNNMHVILDRNACIELNSLMVLVLTEVNTNEAVINESLNQFSGNKINESNQQLSIVNNEIPMEHSDHSISESFYNLHREIDENIKTQCNQNIIYTNNDIIFPNNELHPEEPVVDIVTKTKKDQNTELKKELYRESNVKSLAELCTNILTKMDNNLFSKDDNIMPTVITKDIKVTDHDIEFDKNIDIEVNGMVPLEIMDTDAINETELNVISSKQLNSILLEEFITNLSPQSNNTEIMDFITNFNTDLNKTGEPEFNNNISDINIECQKLLEKGMPELTVISSELNEDQLLESKDDRDREFQHINTETYPKELHIRESDKDLEMVLPISDDQHMVVNGHLDVVDSILNRDTSAEFDLSLLLSDTPIPDEEIQDVGNNDSLDGVEGNPNWIQLPTDEMPQIIDDILDQVSPFFENMDLFDKFNKLNLDKALQAIEEHNEIITPIKDSTSNIEQFEEHIINNVCKIGELCSKKSSSQIDKQVIPEFSNYNEPGLEQNNNICNVNKANESKRVTEEKCYHLYDEQNDKQILEEYIQSNNERCQNFGQDQNIDEGYKHVYKETQDGNESINHIPNYVITKSDKIEGPIINLCFEESEESLKEQNGLGIDKYKVLNYEDIPKESKKCDKESNNQTYQPRFDQPIKISLEESSPKFKNQNQGRLESSVLDINNQYSGDFNEKTIEEVNITSNEEHLSDAPSVNEMNSDKLKRVIFEECFDPECGNNCKNQKHTSITESHKEDVQIFKNQTNNICQPDIKKRKRGYDIFYKRQCIDNFKKQLSEGCFDSDITQKKHLNEHLKFSYNEKYKTQYKKIGIDQLPGKYIELKWIESEGKSNSLSPERKHKKISSEQSDNDGDNQNVSFPHHMAECPECGYTTDDTNLINYQSDVDLRITKPLSLINKETLLSLHDTITENNNNQVPLKSLYAMEFAYVTAIQALEKKLKQKIAISDYRLRRVNNLSKINNKLIEANIMLTDITDENKI